MTHIDEVAEGTYRLRAQIPKARTPFTVYFIKEPGGVLVEPGPSALVPVIQAAIKQLELSDLEYIIPTHIHLDHGGAVGELSRLFPEAKVVVHPQGARHVIDPSQLIRGTRIAFGEDFETIYGAILPVPESQVKIVQDGERLLVGSRELEIIHTTGHAPHHIAIFDTKVKGLFCGEALGLIYNTGSLPLPAVAPPSLDVEVYLSGMERLRQLKPRLLFYSHDGIGNEPEKLISSVVESTKVIGDAVLQALRTEKTDEAVARRVGEYVRRRYGVKLEGHDLAMNVGGFAAYFKKKGLV
jgi:glyoxylase-like metal-dependent hydrolase (beta-lactamase superfamily II)